MRRALAAVGLMLLSSAASASWQEASSKHFRVYADDEPAKVLAFATMLERADKAMRVLRASGDPAISPMARVTVFVVRNMDAVHRLYGRGGGDVAGFYEARASGSVAFVPRQGSGSSAFDLSATQVLLHEYAHHFMYANYGDAVYPGWLVEGFAEFHATTRVDRDGVVTVGEPPLYRGYGLVTSDLPLKTLLTAQPQSLTGEAQNSFYGRGWLLTHYLTMDDDRRRTFGQYLAAINKGQSPLEAAKVFGSPAALDNKLKAYVNQRLNVFKIPAARVPIDPVTVRALTPGEAATMPARIASTRGVDAKSAPAVAALARKLAAPYPDDAGAQNVLAEAEFDAGDQAAALAAAKRALAADRGSIHAMIYQGLAIMAAAHPGDDATTWAAARGWFRRANRLDPEYAWPLQLYYGSYVAAKAAPTRNAQDGLLYARELAPFDPGLDLAAAYVDLARNDAAAATRVLQLVAYDPHGGAMAKVAQRILDAIAKDGAKAALAMLDAAQQEGKATPGNASPRSISPPPRLAPSARAR